MILIIISWFIIFSTLFSLGDMYIHIYQKICKCNEEIYDNVIDVFILGMCIVLILLQLSSIWLPSNQYILCLYIVASIIYWLFNRRRMNEYLKKMISFFHGISPIQKIIIVLFICFILFNQLYSGSFYDELVYHQQQVRWNEEYAVVPGLGNLEDRFGFNSNYLLLSAVFSSRFVMGEAFFTLQSLLFSLIIIWALAGVFKNKFNIQYVIILIVAVIIGATSTTMLSVSSTDIIPILCIFYFLSKSALNPKWIYQKPLLACLLPVTLVTFKLSTALFCLVCVAVLIYLVKSKKYSNIIFIITSSVLVVIFWLIRNVIVTGYLVYPLYEIDLFSFDWKMPKATLVLEKIHISEWARFIFNYEYLKKIFIIGPYNNRIYYINQCIQFLFLIIIIIFPIFIIYSIWKNKKTDKNLYLYYGVSIICIAFSFINAPDPRFFNGYVFGCIVLLSCWSLQILTLSDISFKKFGYIIILFLALFMLKNIMKKNYLLTNECNLGNKVDLIGQLLICPWREPIDMKMEEYNIGQLDIYLVEGTITYDLLPATNPGGIPFEPFLGDKLQSVETIESRSAFLQDGFKTKSEYIEILNNNIEKYKSEYEEKYANVYNGGLYNLFK